LGKEQKASLFFCSISILFPTEKNFQNNFLCRRSLVSENVDWNNNYEKGKDQFTFLVFTNNLIFYAIIGNYIENTFARSQINTFIATLVLKKTTAQ
jgi:hypothetical protein